MYFVSLSQCKHSMDQISEVTTGISSYFPWRHGLLKLLSTLQTHCALGSIKLILHGSHRGPNVAAIVEHYDDFPLGLFPCIWSMLSYFPHYLPKSKRLQRFLTAMKPNNKYDVVIRMESIDGCLNRQLHIDQYSSNDCINYTCSLTIRHIL